METVRDSKWYREEAAQLREKAVAADHEQLRESYLALAREYDRLADVMEDRR
jgi:hypothetical protein